MFHQRIVAVKIQLNLVLYVPTIICLNQPLELIILTFRVKNNGDPL